MQWVKRLSDNCDFNYVYAIELDLMLKEKIWQCNLSKHDSVNVFSSKSFWHQLMSMWAEHNYHIPEGKEQVGSQILWYNSKLKLITLF